MKMLDLFSGIGGFALAAQWVWGDDLEIVSFCEIDKFCQKVLKKHWPDVPICEDIRRLNHEFIANGKSYRLETGRVAQRQHREQSSRKDKTPQIDVLTGGFPCQPFSVAGQRRAREDDRYLWPEMLEVVREFNPRWVVGENVAGIINLALDEVCASLEMEGYEVWPLVIPACAKNAPHRRDRVWIIGCNPFGMGLSGNARRRTRKEFADGYCDDADTTSKRQQGQGEHKRPLCAKTDKNREANTVAGNNSEWNKNWIEVAAELCGVDDGLSAELDGFKLSRSKHRQERIKSLGNAIVPQIAEVILRAIKKIDSL
jgi:DNA (cytosine-5)-methyltransferase 1